MCPSEWTQPTADLNRGYSVLFCFCAIVYIALLWEGWITGQYEEHYVCVCVKFFVYGSVCGLCACVFVCLRETVPYVESGCGFGPRPYL